MLGSFITSYLRRKYPYYPSKNYLYKEDPIRVKQLKKTGLLFTIAVLAYLFILPVFYAALISKIVETVYVAFLPEHATYYPLDWVTYFVSSIPLAFGTFFVWSEWTFKLFLQSDYPEFEDYYSCTQRMDNRKVGMIFTKIGLVCTLITFPFILGSRVVTYEHQITIRDFYGISEHRYSYDKVEQIKYYDRIENRSGAIQPRDDYQIHFSDGYIFFAGAYMSDKKKSKNLVDSIAQYSGKTIVNSGINYYKK